MTKTPPALIDSFGRHVRYLRLSVTDRCDFRCTYCMAEDMVFLPRSEVLTLEELSTVATAFAELGVSRIRITGGEPLIRRDVEQLLHSASALREVTDLSITTNASHLEEKAQTLKDAGVDRLNISLDTLDPKRFKTLTRHGDLAKVLRGIDAAQKVGFKRIKINSVILKNVNFDEAADLARFALEGGMDISFIEEMPLGEIHSHARNVEFVSSSELQNMLQQSFTLTPSQHTTGGPSRYWQADDFDNLIGFISPHSNNFCGDCNRVRVTASGKLLLCLGNEHSVDLRHILRSNPAETQVAELKHAIVASMAIKPEKHEFNLDEAPQILRFMNATGG